MATVKSFKADVSSVSPSSKRPDEGVTLETSALQLLKITSIKVGNYLNLFFLIFLLILLRVSFDVLIP